MVLKIDEANMKNVVKVLFLVLLMYGCFAARQTESYKSERLRIEQLTKGTYLHTSFLPTEKYGKVPCNGMIVIDKRKALVFDSPVSDEDSEELIAWIEQEMGSSIEGIVVNHFHVDCLGGLEAFHKRNIPSYATNETIALAKEENAVIPKIGYEERLDLTVGNLKVVNKFLGEGHTRDNTVSYVPKEKVLFGGCLIKALGSGKGNLADANVQQWSNTVKQVRDQFADVKIVIPGHGKYGGKELLDYTIDKFAQD